MLFRKQFASDLWAIIGIYELTHVVQRTDREADALIYGGSGEQSVANMTATLLDEMIPTMSVQDQERLVILVLDDIEETRYLTERMLKVNGYNVALARNEEEAISEALTRSPSLILMSLGLEPEGLLASARRIRQEAALSEDVAIVIFCVATIPEGAEMEVHKNVYMTHPDNFNQLRGFLHRVLHNERSTR